MYLFFIPGGKLRCPHWSEAVVACEMTVPTKNKTETMAIIDVQPRYLTFRRQDRGRMIRAMKQPTRNVSFRYQNLMIQIYRYSEDLVGSFKKHI